MQDMYKYSKNDLAVEGDINDSKFGLDEYVFIYAYYPHHSSPNSERMEKIEYGCVKGILSPMKHQYMIVTDEDQEIYANEEDMKSVNHNIASRQIIHKVQAGETLASIGEKYEVTVATIIENNSSKYSTIHLPIIRVGWELIIK